MSTPESNDLTLQAAHRLESSPFLSLLGIEPVECLPGSARMKVTVAEKHSRYLGILHGGVTCTMLDTTLGAAAATLLKPNQTLVTVQLNVNFIRPGWPNEVLLSEARVLHQGRKTLVVQGQIATQDGELVASASGTFMPVIIPDQPQELEHPEA